jgi:hypothetical protein
MDESKEKKNSKNPDSLIKVDINGIVFFNKDNAVDTYVDVIQHMTKDINYVKLCSDFPKYFTLEKSFPQWKNQKPSMTKRDKNNQFTINTNTGSNRKGQMLAKIFDNYNYSYRIDIIDKESQVILNTFVPDEKSVEKVSDNKIEVVTEIKFVKNPFGGEKNSSASCITGESGDGKSYRAEKTLKKYNHNYIFENYDPTSTGILTQYIGSGVYERNNVGEFIVKAKSDPSNYYTVVLDECHKDGFIDRINSELLQCFSTKRNDGLRFFSTNKSTDYLFVKLDEKNGRRVIPDNVGFILITSKRDIIENNDDIKNRVDIINILKEDREKDFDIKYLLKDSKQFVEQFENQD